MCVKGVSTGLVLSLQGDNQLMKPIFWAFLLAMFFTLICQIRYLNKAMASFGVSEVCLCFAQCRPPIHRQSSDAGGRAYVAKPVGALRAGRAGLLCMLHNELNHDGIHTLSRVFGKLIATAIEPMP